MESELEGLLQYVVRDVISLFLTERDVWVGRVVGVIGSALGFLVLRYGPLGVFTRLRGREKAKTWPVAVWSARKAWALTCWPFTLPGRLARERNQYVLTAEVEMLRNQRDTLAVEAAHLRKLNGEMASTRPVKVENGAWCHTTSPAECCGR